MTKGDIHMPSGNIRQVGSLHATQNTYAHKNMSQHYLQDQMTKVAGWLEEYLCRQYQLRQPGHPSCGHEAIEQKQTQYGFPVNEEGEERVNTPHKGQDRGTSGEQKRDSTPLTRQVRKISGRL